MKNWYAKVIDYARVNNVSHIAALDAFSSGMTDAIYYWLLPIMADLDI